MGLPKNYQQTVNLNKRVEALNDLNFYTFKYKLNLTEETVTTIYENLEKDVVETIEEVIGSITVNKKGEAFGEKTFTSTDDKRVNEKYESWVSKIKDMGLVMDSEIIEITKKTFIEELEDKNLTELLKRKGE